MLEIRDLSVCYGEKKILDKVGFCVRDGEWMMIIGPNGSGKSTTVNAVSGGIRYLGQILLDGKDIRQYKRKELASSVGILMQNHYVGYGFTVEEVVRLGRYAHRSGLFSADREDSEFYVQQALELTGMDGCRNQSVVTLSGGELQRTFLAQLLAQNPSTMILDEPTNHLDLVYQKQVFELVDQWRKMKGGTVISVVHDLSLAKRYGTHGVLLQNGHVEAKGTIDDVIRPEMINPVYQMDVYRWMQDLYRQWESNS